MNITDCVFELEKLKAENSGLRKRLTKAEKLHEIELQRAIKGEGQGFLNAYDNAILRERLTRCTQDNFELCQDAAILVSELSGKTVELKSLQAAAENLIFKYRKGVPLEAVDFEWLERAVGGENEMHGM